MEQFQWIFLEQLGRCFFLLSSTNNVNRISYLDRINISDSDSASTCLGSFTTRISWIETLLVVMAKANSGKKATVTVAVAFATTML
jgi:hypothetical protein